MTPEFLASISAIVLSLLASYLPGFSTWYDKLAPNLKRAVMLALVALVALGCYGLACTGLAESLNIPATCNELGAIEILRAFIAALVANQATFLISPKKAS